VGEAPPPELVAAASRRDDTTVTGRVADVAPHLAAAAVVVAPLRLGRGMRVKVLEAMAAGKAVVASPLALEGLDVRDGHEVLVAEGADATARAVHALLADRPRRRALADAARAWAEESRTWDDWHDDYTALYASLAGRP
jgi:glycosyltransferase involved in cell wall biosynthesis